MGPIVQQISAVFGSDLNLNRSSGSVDEIGGIIDKPFMVYAWKRSCLPMQNFLASHELIKPSRNRRRQPLVVFASSYGSSPSGSSDGAAGDPKVQQMLVDMVRIQVGKARMIEFVEERSQNLRNIADDVILEYNRIAYRTMKGFDASGSRVLRRLDADASAIEKELMIARAEMEAHSRDFEEFQVRIAYSRNEGLFFKNLYKSPKALRFKGSSTKGLVEKKVAVISTPEKDLASSYRQLLYGGLSLVMVSFLWSSSSAFVAGTCMRASKLASYAVIFSLLLAQLAYIKVILGVEDNTGGDD